MWYYLSNMTLWELISDIRLKHGLTQKEFAQRIKRSAMAVSLMERSPGNGGSIPSERVLREIAAEFSATIDEKREMEQILLLARARAIAPSEIAGLFDNKIKQFLSSGERMPEAFITRLSEDINALPDKALFYKKLSFDKALVERALNGEVVLSRSSVIELAQKLNQSVEGYLLLSDYLPAELGLLAQNKQVLTLFRSMGNLEHNELDQLLQVVSGVLSLHNSPKKK